MTFKSYLNSVLHKDAPPLNIPRMCSAFGVALMALTAGTMLVAVASALQGQHTPVLVLAAIPAMGAAGIALLRRFPVSAAN